MQRARRTSVLAALFLVAGIALPLQALAADTYADWGQLAANETAGVDYRIRTQSFPSEEYLVMAIHGGGIEGGTSELAEAIAGSNYNFYLFEGLKSSGNSVLHITATNFDEPTAIKMAAQATGLISLHGAKNNANADPIVWMGGQDTGLRDLIITRLSAAGFDARIAAPGSGYEGTADGNICNKSRILAGVQLEMTKSLRESFFVGGNRHNAPTQAFHDFVAAVRAAITDHTLDGADRDLDLDPLYSTYLYDYALFKVNPASSFITFNLGTTNYDSYYSGVRIEFFDSEEQLYTTRSYYAGINSRRVELPLSFLPDGYYFIRVVQLNSQYPSWMFGMVHNIPLLH